MKVAVFSTFFLPHRGGVELYTWQTAKRLVAEGHEVTVITCRLKGMKEKETIDGIHVVRLPCAVPIKDMFAVPLALYVPICDVIVTHTRFYPLTWMAGLIAKVTGRRWVHIEHGTKQVKYENPIVYLIAKVADMTCGRLVMRKAKVLGVSSASAQFAKSLGAKKVDVVYNGTDCSFFDGRKKAHKGFNVAFVGRLVEEKGVQDLLKATKNLKVNVTIVGSGSYESELKKYTHAKFVGSKDSAGVRKVLSESDILVNPSYAEGLPTAVLEAGAMGLAVIATDVGGTKEIIDDKNNGSLVQPRDVKMLRTKIEQLMHDDTLRERFGKELQKKVRKTFDWDVISKKFIRALDR